MGSTTLGTRRLVRMRQSNSDTCCLEKKGVVAVEQRWTFDGDDTEALAAFVGHLPGAMMTIPSLLLVGGTLDLAVAIM